MKALALIALGAVLSRGSCAEAQAETPDLRLAYCEAILEAVIASCVP